MTREASLGSSEEQLSQERESASLAGKYLTYALDKEVFGLSILKVTEIIGIINITAVPAAPPHVKGVINLRGRIIPVIDLRLKFGMQPAPYDEKTCIIVVTAACRGRALSVGMIVDTVLEVRDFEAGRISPPPELSSSGEAGFIIGIGQAENNDVVILMDPDRALGDAEGLVQL